MRTQRLPDRWSLWFALYAAWWFVATAVAAPGPPEPPAMAIAQVAPTSARDLFRLDRIWTVHVTVAPDEWAAMQPRPMGPGETPRNGIAGYLALDEAHADLEFERHGLP